MVSVIVCSVNPQYLESITTNIEETIGTPYEIISIDNRKGLMGICAAYNAGGNRARYPYLCFVHEDVLFETQGWGVQISKYLSDPSIGLIGVAGGDCKSIVPSSWSIPVLSTEVNIMQHFDKSSGKKPIHVRNSLNIQNEAQDVVLIDGVFMCTRKDIFNTIQFDQLNFPGFHGYDIDYSLQISKKYSLKVVSTILLHHFSEGKPGKEWLASAIQVSKKWKKSLPISLYSNNKELLTTHHWKCMQVYLQHLKRLNYPVHSIISQLIKCSTNRFFRLRPWLSMVKFVLTHR